MSSVATWPSQAENWLDERGKGAWIAAMVLGFIFIWPVGLALLFYMIWSKRMSSRSFSRSFGCSHSRHKSARHSSFRSSGNVAFDSYKEETLKRLEDEQEAFRSFLDRLREAKDKTEFDQFMDDRAKGAKPANEEPVDA
jgi:uncharacterized protein DUF2852